MKRILIGLALVTSLTGCTALNAAKDGMNNGWATIANQVHKVAELDCAVTNAVTGATGCVHGTDAKGTQAPFTAPAVTPRPTRMYSPEANAVLEQMDQEQRLLRLEQSIKDAEQAQHERRYLDNLNRSLGNRMVY